MSCETTSVNEKGIIHFNKIRLLNDIANHIGSYGVSCGNETLLDYMDLNCGAVPDGEFEQVIDLSSPNQFLSLYMQIAENRFACVVTEMLKMNKGYFAILSEFCNRIGREMNIDIVTDIETAFEVMESFILDGMPCDETKEIILKETGKIQWKKIVDTHESAWKKAGGDISVYYSLQKEFVNGIFEESGIKLEIEENSLFTLEITSRQ